MGFDVSYHPVSEKEIGLWYFSALAKITNGKQDEVFNFAAKTGMEEFYIKKYLDTLRVGAEIVSGELFEKTHGFYIAVIQGFFRKYFYTRGSAFTFLIEADPIFWKYTVDIRTLVPEGINTKTEGKIVENYSSGVYIPADKVAELLYDYENSQRIKNALDEIFSYGRNSVFLSALKFASGGNWGILEATEVVMPNPLDSNKSESFSNLFNCDKEGPLLYEKAVAKQIGGIESKAKK